MKNPIGVCSWSLRARSPQDLAWKVSSVGLARVQIALDPLRRGDWEIEETLEHLSEAHASICSGMMAMEGEDYSTLETIRRTGGVLPDETWEDNLRHASDNARLAALLEIDLVSFHAGFLPEDPGDPVRAKAIERLREVVDLFADQGVDVAFETGQESAETMMGFLEELDRPDAGVNFDPANMLLYGTGDPVEALRLLAPRVWQVHLKDAKRPEKPGEWGTEVPLGSGEVDWKAFFEALHECELSCDLMIERESGGDRVGDVRKALELAKGLAQ